MIGLDTSVLVRYVMQDDAKQSPLATRFVESLTTDEPGFLSLISMIELVWVLSTAYLLERTQLVDALEGILRTKEFIVERAETVWKAVRIYQSGSADFADCLIERSGASAGCSRTMTFDRGAAKSCGMTLLA